MDSEIGQHKDKEGDEGSSKIKGQNVLKDQKFDNKEKEEPRLRILSCRESCQRYKKVSQNKRFLRINYVESESEDGEEMISLAAIKAKYKPLISGKPHKNAAKGQAQRPHKIRRIISDGEDKEEPPSLQIKVESQDGLVINQKNIIGEEDECAVEGQAKSL